MAVPSHPAVTWSQYLGARLAAMTLEMFEVDTNLRTAREVGRWVHRLDRRHRERALTHLRQAFPEKTEPEIQRLAVQAFEHLVSLVVEVIHTPRQMTPGAWASRIRLRNLHDGLDLLSGSDPAILVTGHVGNWEIVGYLLSMLGFEIDALARPIDNPLVNDWLLGIRQRQGLKVITKFNATDRMLEVIDRGGTLAFIADQNAGEKGLFVPFFGRLASTYKSIGLLAIDRDVPIICGYGQRVGRGFGYEVGLTDVIRPEQWKEQPDPLFYVTARYMAAIEQMVRRRPAQYFWMHRRWKSRPRHERKNRPMPEKLQMKIRSLPWISDSEADRIIADGSAQAT